MHWLYELWHRPTHNLVRTFTSRRAAASWLDERLEATPGRPLTSGEFRLLRSQLSGDVVEFVLASPDPTIEEADQTKGDLR
jgi:hypothetical protein